jgi:hypothetical protein
VFCLLSGGSFYWVEINVKPPGTKDGIVTRESARAKRAPFLEVWQGGSP